MRPETTFPRLVTLACHDLRTPLATVHGFARTLLRIELHDPAPRYVEMIDAASMQLAELLDELALVARIEAGRFDPALMERDSLELAREAAAELEDARVVVTGEGAAVLVEPDLVRRALRQLARAAVRHGGLESAELTVRGALLEIAPITASSAKVVLGQELRELGAAAAVALIEALGGSLAVEDGRLEIRLPS